MVIRDDRGAKTARGYWGPFPEPTRHEIAGRPTDFAPDAVLYNCPDCGRSHFVTVDDCPDAETAARETAMVKRAA